MAKKVDLRLIGPGIVLAAAGVGAGDVIASGASGASYGFALLWALAIGAFFKYYLNEGMARYQLSTKETIVEGFARIGKPVIFYFIAYLAVWSFVVGGALLSGIGLVLSEMIPVLGLKAWAIAASLSVLLVVFSGSYPFFEKAMKAFAGIMFLSFFISTIMIKPGLVEILKGLIPALPSSQSFFDSAFKALALLGGVGGTVTIAAYGYWLREKGIRKKSDLATVRLDLAIGYIITFLFGLFVMAVAASMLYGNGITLKGKQGIIELALGLSTAIGSFGYWSFMLGFFAAIFSSLMSFYQAIPYLFSDSIRLVKGLKGKEAEKAVSMKSKYYLGYAAYCAFVPMVLLFVEKPVFLILAYSVLGAFFMPFLAFAILVLNNSKKLGNMKNRLYHNIIMAAVFVVMAIVSFWPLIKKLFG